MHCVFTLCVASLAGLHDVHVELCTVYNGVPVFNSSKAIPWTHFQALCGEQRSAYLHAFDAMMESLEGLPIETTAFRDPVNRFIMFAAFMRVVRQKPIKGAPMPAFLRARRIDPRAAVAQGVTICPFPREHQHNILVPVPGPDPGPGTSGAGQGQTSGAGQGQTLSARAEARTLLSHSPNCLQCMGAATLLHGATSGTCELQLSARNGLQSVTTSSIAGPLLPLRAERDLPGYLMTFEGGALFEAVPMPVGPTVDPGSSSTSNEAGAYYSLCETTPDNMLLLDALAPEHALLLVPPGALLVVLPNFHGMHAATALSSTNLAVSVRFLAGQGADAMDTR